MPRPRFELLINEASQAALEAAFPTHVVRDYMRKRTQELEANPITAIDLAFCIESAFYDMYRVSVWNQLQVAEQLKKAHSWASTFIPSGRGVLNEEVEDLANLFTLLAKTWERPR